MQIQNNMDYIAKNVGVSGQLAGAVQSIPRETGRMAMVVVATVPIAILYPFFQRYFVKGLTIGGVKQHQPLKINRISTHKLSSKENNIKEIFLMKIEKYVR